jgi:hypothetical protein
MFKFLRGTIDHIRSCIGKRDHKDIIDKECRYSTIDGLIDGMREGETLYIKMYDKEKFDKCYTKSLHNKDFVENMLYQNLWTDYFVNGDLSPIGNVYVIIVKKITTSTHISSFNITMYHPKEIRDSLKKDNDMEYTISSGIYNRYKNVNMFNFCDHNISKKYEGDHFYTQYTILLNSIKSVINTTPHNLGEKKVMIERLNNDDILEKTNDVIIPIFTIEDICDEINVDLIHNTDVNNDIAVDTNMINSIVNNDPILKSMVEINDRALKEKRYIYTIEGCLSKIKNISLPVDHNNIGSKLKDNVEERDMCMLCAKLTHPS